MEFFLHNAAVNVALVLESISILVIALGGIEAAYRVFWPLLRRQVRDGIRRAAWLSLARWLVLGLEFMLAVTEAVERLHQHKLIHRDIKPANLIFVNGRPKLADIDLVTDLSPHGEASHIGTEGYMAPEGPGAAAADVFSLGRILYVALTGKPPDQSPERPTRIASHPDSALFMELNDIVCKACEFDLERRYASAALMREELLNVFHRLPGLVEKTQDPARHAGNRRKRIGDQVLRHIERSRCSLRRCLGEFSRLRHGV